MASSLEKLASAQPEERSIDVAWRSFELRPQSAPPPSQAYLEQIQAKRPALYATAKSRYGLEMNAGPFGIDTRPALTGAKFAELKGKGPAYHARIMQAYWQEAQDIGDRDVLAAIAESVGLDAVEFRVALEDPAFTQQVDADIQTARQYGLNGVPALVFEETYLVSGAQPVEVLQQVVDRVLEEDR